MNSYHKIRTLSFILIGGSIIAAIFSLMALHGHHAPYPFDFYQRPELIYYADFTTVWLPAYDHNPYPLLGIYFPFAYVPFFLFKHCAINAALYSYFSVFLIGFGLFNYHFFIDKKIRFSEKPCYYLQVMSFPILAYPVLFCLQRGNIDTLIFIFTCLFVIHFQKKHFLLSILWLAMATAMKGYPGIFSLLFLSNKRYEDFFIFIAATLGLTVLSLVLFKGPILTNLSLLLRNLNGFNDQLMLSNLSMQHNSSLYEFFKTFYLMTQRIPWNPYYPTCTITTGYYSIIALILLTGISIYVIFYEKILWRQLTVLTTSILLLPQIALDYRQLLLFLPIYYFVNANDTFHRQQELFYTILFGLLLIPKNYVFLYGEISISNALNTILLLTLTLSIMRNGLAAQRSIAH